MIKKLAIFLILIYLFPLILAESVNIEYPLGNEFQPGEDITFKVTLYDNSNNPIEGELNVIIEDSTKNSKVEQIINSMQVIKLKLPDAASGQGTITIEYDNIEKISFFEIGRKELAKFILDGDTLKITNVGNTKYTREIMITIGNTAPTTKKPVLDIGESVYYRLIAPSDFYDITITDGKETLTKKDVQLTGTGNVVGALDEASQQRTGITGGISPDGTSDIALLNYIKNNKFVYVFIFVIFGATIVLAISRRFRKSEIK